jgi:hypothetical protein
MRRTVWLGAALLTVVGVGCADSQGAAETAAAQARQASVREVPTFQVDPTWPKLPAKWALGLVADVYVDAQDHVWIQHRFRTAKPGPNQTAAPPVLEFDADGNFIQGWGGPGQGYDWPASEHGIFLDHNGYVWLGGEGGNTGQVLKFTKTGKFVMQIGRPGQSKGSLDTRNFNGASDIWVNPKNNEVFIGDSNGHGRVIVLDGATGAFKRMWGGFGKPPSDPPPGEPLAQLPNDAGGGFDVTTGDGPPFLSQAHCIRVSNDGFMYVCDGPFKRIQVFTLDGKYVTQVFINRGARPKSTNTAMSSLGRPFNEVEEELYGHHETSSRAGLSGDREQRYLFVNDRSTSKVLILDRKTLEVLGSFGDGPGRAPGQFYVLHDVRADSKGNVYTAEVNGDGNRRAQKFVFKGMRTVSTQ